MDLKQIGLGVFFLLLFLLNGPYTVLRGLEQVKKAKSHDFGTASYLRQRVYPMAFPPFDLILSGLCLVGSLHYLQIIPSPLAGWLMLLLALLAFLIYGPFLIFLRIHRKEQIVFRVRNLALSGIFLLSPLLIHVAMGQRGWGLVLGVVWCLSVISLALASREDFNPVQSWERLNFNYGRTKVLQKMSKAALRHLRKVELMVGPEDDLSNLLECPYLKNLSLSLEGAGLSDEQLDLVGQLQTLKSLNIPKFGNRDTVGPLRHLVELESLDLRLDASKFDPDGLRGLSRLQSLHLHGAAGNSPILGNLSFLEELRDLRVLHLFNLELPAPARPLDLPRLETLQIDRNCHGGLLHWNSLPCLKEATLGSEVTELESLDGISAAPNLRKLVLYGQNLDLSPLTDLKYLQDLTLEAASADLSPLSSLAHCLREFCLFSSEAAPLKTLPPMPAMTKLRLYGLDKIPSTLEGIGQAMHLKSLHVADGSPLLDLSPLWNALPDLEDLSIHVYLREIRGLGGLPNLRTLDLMGDDKEPPSLSTLGDLPRLESLELAYVRSLDGLQSAPALKSLKWQLAPGVGLQDCAALADLPSLEKIAVHSYSKGEDREGEARAAKDLVKRIRRLCPKAKVELDA